MISVITYQIITISNLIFYNKNVLRKKAFFKTYCYFLSHIFLQCEINVYF